MSQNKLLFTPGPLTTSETVKESMLRDLGSRDREFLSVVSHIRRHLLELGHVADDSYEAVLMQGSGTLQSRPYFRRSFRVTESSW
jgi:2-aminoethylphosphonate-pyruvate transaminase